jgi:hypothetical protein
MEMAFLRTGPGTCLTADAIARIDNRHHLIAHIVAELIFSLKGLFDKFKYLSVADLVAAATADTFVHID